MSQEDTRIDLSEMKDTDPIISYEQTEEAELVELNSTWDNIVNTFKHNRLAMIGLVVIVLIILAAVFAPVVSPYDPYVQDLPNKLAKPSAEHLLGTDSFGRDMLTRLFYGAQLPDYRLDPKRHFHHCWKHHGFDGRVPGENGGCHHHACGRHRFVVSLLAVGYGYHVYAGGESAEPVYRVEPDQLGHDGENGSRPNIAAA